MEHTAASVSKLSLEDQASLSLVEASKKRKKKKKSSPASKCTLPLIANQKALPSQHIVESRFPWKIVTKPKRGRCAISTRQIKAGELVVSEQALAFVIRTRYRSAACHNCCKDIAETSSEAVPCKACDCSVFCKQCEQAGFASHSRCCSLLKDVYAIAERCDCDEDLLRLVLALAMRRDSLMVPLEEAELEVTDESHPGNIQPSFQDAMALQTHRERISGAWKSSVRQGCEALHSCMVKQNLCLETSAEDLEYLAALVNANAHGMGAQSSHNTDFAIGIFPFVSMLNHSCRPNCCFSSEGSVMQVRANQDILQDTEMCLSYINLYESRATRRNQLASTKHFDCHCQRCMEAFSHSVDRFLEGVLCNIKGCGGVMVKKTEGRSSHALEDERLALWQCTSCAAVLDPALNMSETSSLSERPWDLVAMAQEKLHAALLVYKERRFKEARVLIEDFLAEFSGKLHPLHVLLFDSLTPLMNCCRVLGDAEGGMKACRNIINCLEKVSNWPSLELANFYFCLAEMCTECAEAASISPILVKRYRKQAQEAWQQVCNIRRICLGIKTQSSSWMKLKQDCASRFVKKIEHQ